MASGLPIKEVKTLLNKPGEEIDERFRKLKDIPGIHLEAGYQVIMEGDITKEAETELTFRGSAKTLPLPTTPVSGEIAGGVEKHWQRRGDGDVFMVFYFKATLSA